MVFYTHHIRPDKAQFLEMNPGPKITDPAHVPATAQIESMMIAGVRLKEYRRELYHFGEKPDGKPEEIPEDFEDKTLRSDYDMVDAQMDLSALKDKAIAAEAAKVARDDFEARAKEEAEAAQKVADKELEKEAKAAPEKGA